MNSLLWLQLSSFFTVLLMIEFFLAAEALVLDQNNNHNLQPFPASSEVIEVNAELERSRRALWNIHALGPGWTGHITYSSAIYPYLIGAQILGGFYQKIMRSVSGIWSSTPETNNYLMSYGTIRLWIWSEDPNANITWAFVYDFAARMLMATRQGFVGLIDASFVHIVSGMMVHAKLVIQGKSPLS